MSKYAIQGFTQGFLNSESEKIDREQERADKIADEMRKLRLKGLEQQQADWDANDKAYKKMQALFATGNKSDARQAMAVYATMSGNKDAFDALGEQYDYFNDAAVENLRGRMDGLLKAHGERPSYTVDDLNKNNYRVKRRQTAFESTIKDIFNFGDDTPSWEVTTKRPLPSHGYSSMLRDAVPATEEEVSQPTPLGKIGDTTEGEVTPVENNAGEDWLQPKPEDVKTGVITRRNADGSEDVIPYIQSPSTGAMVQAPGAIGKSPGKPAANLNDHQKQAAYSRVKTIIERWKEDPEMEDFAERFEEDMNAAVTDGIPSGTGDLFWSRYTQIFSLSDSQIDPAGAAELVMKDMEEMYRYGFIEPKDRAWWGTGDDYYPKTPEEIYAIIKQKEASGAIDKKTAMMLVQKYIGPITVDEE